MTPINQYLVKGQIELTIQKSLSNIKTTESVILIATNRKTTPLTQIPEYLYLEDEPDVPIAISDLTVSVEAFLSQFYQRQCILKKNRFVSVKFTIDSVSLLNIEIDREALQLSFPNNQVNFFMESL